MCLLSAQYLLLTEPGTVSKSRLHHLVYLSHMLHLGEHREPLITGTLYASALGLTHPLLERTTVTGRQDVALPSSGKISLDRVHQYFRRRPSSDLAAFVHRDGGAWDEYYVRGQRTPVPNQALIEEYESLISSAGGRLGNCHHQGAGVVIPFRKRRMP